MQVNDARLIAPRLATPTKFLSASGADFCIFLARIHSDDLHPISEQEEEEDENVVARGGGGGDGGGGGGTRVRFCLSVPVRSP